MGSSGLLPLTWTTIRDWSFVTGEEIEEHEAQALLIIDRTLLYPSDDEEEES
jgi:hypothetical protein